MKMKLLSSLEKVTTVLENERAEIIALKCFIVDQIHIMQKKYNLLQDISTL